MKAKIDVNGNLYLERHGELKPQFCLHQLVTRCGDWCPLFRVGVVPTPKDEKGNVIFLCGKTMVAIELIDERK